MYNASDVQFWLYSSSCPHNDIRLPCIFHQLQTHSGGNYYPKHIPSPQTICPILWARQALSARVGGMKKCFAHYRRRLPAGSLCCTITALWGCLTEANERAKRGKECEDVSSDLCSYITLGSSSFFVIWQWEHPFVSLLRRGFFATVFSF